MLSFLNVSNICKKTFMPTWYLENYFCICLTLPPVSTACAHLHIRLLFAKIWKKTISSKSGFLNYKKSISYLSTYIPKHNILTIHINSWTTNSCQWFFHVRFFTNLGAVINRQAKIINDMANVNKKTEKNTSFSVIFHVMN